MREQYFSSDRYDGLGDENYLGPIRPGEDRRDFELQDRAPRYLRYADNLERDDS